MKIALVFLALSLDQIDVSVSEIWTCNLPECDGKLKLRQMSACDKIR